MVNVQQVIVLGVIALWLYLGITRIAPWMMSSIKFIYGLLRGYELIDNHTRQEPCRKQMLKLGVLHLVAATTIFLLGNQLLKELSLPVGLMGLLLILYGLDSDIDEFRFIARRTNH